MGGLGADSASEFSSVFLATLLGVFLCGLAFSAAGEVEAGESVEETGRVVGVAFVSLQVADLERSVAFYRALGFVPSSTSHASWVLDDAANRLYGTQGAMSRTAVMEIPSTASGMPFVLNLNEYKGMERGSRADYPARDPSSTHLGILVPEADALWEKLRVEGMLRPLSWDGKLVRLPGRTSGGIAYIMDPDGFDIEIIGVPSPPDAPAAIANRPSLHHFGIAVLNSAKSRSFYGSLLGGRFPESNPEWLSGDMYDAAVGGRGYVIRLINGTFPEAAAQRAEFRFELVEYQKPNRTVIPGYKYSDVGVSCVGMQVQGLDALHARLKSAGVDIWSEGGIVGLGDGTRSVVVRDPDVQAFVELFEKPAR